MSHGLGSAYMCACVRKAKMQVHHHSSGGLHTRCIRDARGVALSLYIEVIVEALLER